MKLSLTPDEAAQVNLVVQKARLAQARLDVRNQGHPSWAPLTLDPLELALLTLTDRLTYAMRVVVAAAEYVDEIGDTRGAYEFLCREVGAWRAAVNEPKPQQVWEKVN